MNLTNEPDKFRLPDWLADGTRRWRMRIGYHFGKNGSRVEKLFYWRRPDDNGGVPPPDVQAEAVAVQRTWRQLKRDWAGIVSGLKFVFPNRDWSKPVWCDDEQAKLKAGEAAGLAQGVATANAEFEAEELAAEQQAVRWVTRNGLDALVNALRQPSEPPVLSRFASSVERDQAVVRVENYRLTALAELAPTVARRLVTSVTIREAVLAYLAKVESRVALKTSRGILQDTSSTEARRLYGAFGLSSNLAHTPIRPTPINIDAPLVSLEKKTLINFADFWHELPEGIDSERTVKNHLEAVRQFLIWCEEEDDYGYHLPALCKRVLTASDVEREAVPFEPESLLKLVKAGGRRGQTYILFGLCFGFYQMDIAETVAEEMSFGNGCAYVQRYRSKEKRRKRGRRPLKVRHFIPPEFDRLIKEQQQPNLFGTLFNTEHGTPLTAAAIHDRWQDVQARAGVDLMFSQLRKIGYNAMKRLGASEGVQLAEFWDGHAKGVSESYCDGVWPAMNEIEQLWADELRKHQILT